jgi:hypothetical protein
VVIADWRLPENRREAWHRYYTHALTYQNHPGCVYALLPAIAEAFNMDDDQRAWLVWLNGNTQNAVTSLLLLEAAPTPADWEKAVAFWNAHFKLLEWDTDRRHQKSKFGVATEEWFWRYGDAPAAGWEAAGKLGWEDTWRWSFNQPYMGRLSAWSMLEYARILLPGRIPDAETWLLEDKAGSRSHRNGIALVAGYDSVYWEEDAADTLGIVQELEDLAEDLLAEATRRNSNLPDPSHVCRLTMESAFCTYKSWHKPDRRYPNVYSDMMYQRIKKAEARFGRTLDLLWQARREHLPPHLRLEDCPHDPGLSRVKQNHYRLTGQIPIIYREWPDMEPSGFDLDVAQGRYGVRKDPKWTT